MISVNALFTIWIWLCLSETNTPSLVVANKMDLPEAAENLKEFKRITNTNPIELSALTGDGTDALRNAIEEMTEKK